MMCEPKVIYFSTANQLYDKAAYDRFNKCPRSYHDKKYDSASKHHTISKRGITIGSNNIDIIDDLTENFSHVSCENQHEDKWSPETLNELTKRFQEIHPISSVKNVRSQSHMAQGDFQEIFEIVNNMLMSMQSEKWQEQACMRLVNLTNKNTLNKNALTSVGGILAVMAIMAIYPHNSIIQENACVLLHSLVYKHENQIAMASADVVSLILKVLITNERNRVIQEQGCGILAHLTFIDQSLRDEIIRSNGVFTVINSMREHPLEGKIQEKSCLILYTLFHYTSIRLNEDEYNEIVSVLGEAARNFPAECLTVAQKTLYRL